MYEIAQNFDTLHQPGGGRAPRPPHLLRRCLQQPEAYTGFEVAVVLISAGQALDQ